ILAGAALLSHTDEAGQGAGCAIREATLEAVAGGCRTADLGGHSGSREFSDEVSRRTKQKLEVWSSL
ncbi:MAG: isocitrate/isopropylmalate family dehydrogenase, partial [Gaiellaceae bacterium]